MAERRRAKKIDPDDTEINKLVAEKAKLLVSGLVFVRNAREAAERAATTAIQSNTDIVGVSFQSKSGRECAVFVAVGEEAIKIATNALKLNELTTEPNDDHQ